MADVREYEETIGSGDDLGFSSGSPCQQARAVIYGGINKNPKSTLVKVNARETNRRYQVLLSPEVSEGLKQLSRSAGVPLKSVLLAAHMRVLSLLSNQSDIITGLVSHGRPEEIDGERALGLFLNTLPFRLKLLGGTWLDLVRKTFEAEQESLPFKHYPLAQLQNTLGGQRLFETMFSFTRFHVLENLLKLKKMQILSWKSIVVDTNIPLTADFSLNPFLSSPIQLVLEYDVTKLSEKQVEAMGSYYTNTLIAMVNSPLDSYESKHLLSVEEQQLLLVEWNNTTTDYPNNTCIHQLFEAQVERTPNAVAVVFENQQLTYQQLNRRANQLAHRLQKLGVKPEVTVGICLERSLEMLVALLAIFKAGGAYIPLDPTYPTERLAFMLEDSQVLLLLTTEKIIQNSLYASGKVSTNRIDSNEQSPSNPEQLTVIILDKTWETINRENPENPKSNVNPPNLAYILYTSGSTGFPKGVAIEHRSTVNFINWAQTVFNPEQLAGVLASTSICFDLSIFELFVPLSCGGKVILVENALYLPTLKAAQDVTLINTVPSAIAELLRANLILQKVQTVNLAGEPLSQQLINQLYQQETLQQVFNLYGPSEATTYSTFTLCVPTGGGNEKVHHSPSIGRPIANTQIYILDSHLQPVPIGVPGELHIGGDGLARSYLNRPDLTEEKFIPNPFNNSKSKIQNCKGDRLYKTGDLARYLPDGNIEFLGRLDNQVKIRGFRIELGEIESTLAQHATVKQCVVMAREDITGEQRLVVYIIPHQQQTSTPNELRRFLKQKLPDYMVPSTFVFIDTLPLTPNGKIDRRALPVPDQSRPSLEEIFVAPRTPIEQQITDIWASILKLENVGIHDNFFALGGHSLLATQVISRLRQALKVELPLRVLFEAPTVAELSSRIETVRWASQQLQVSVSDTLGDYEEGRL